MQDKVHPMHTPSPASSLGKEIASFTTKYRSHMTILDGGIRVTYWKPWISPCLGWNISYEIIPKQCLVSVDVKARMDNSCCCCCPVYDCVVSFEILKRGDLIVPEEDRKRSCWQKMCCKKNYSDPNQTEDAGQITGTGGGGDADNSDEEDEEKAMGKQMKNHNYAIKKELKKFTFSWDQEMLQENAKILHNYVYGSVAGTGNIGDSHNLAHYVSQGLVRPSKCKIKLSKF